MIICSISQNNAFHVPIVIRVFQFDKKVYVGYLPETLLDRNNISQIKSSFFKNNILK